MKKKMLLIPLALLLAISLVATGCPRPLVKEEVKTITIGTAYFPGSVNPFVEILVTYWGIQQWIYDRLYQLGPNNEAIPDLAEEIVVSPDGKTYTISLRRNAQFHDGTPLTAHDVAFTYNYIIDNEMAWYLGYVGPIAKVEALGDYTVQITLDAFIARGWLNYNTFLFVPILPRHIWENITAEEALGELPVEKLIGSGPFQLVEFRPDELIRLRATRQAKEELGVDVDEVIIRAFADEGMMLLELRAGTIDAVFVVSMKAVPALEGVPEITLHPLPAIWLDTVIFNSFPHAYEEGRERHPHPALQDVRIRQALDWALDEEKAARIAFGEFGIPGRQYLSLFYGDYSHTELEPRGFDLDKARQILAEAGYIDTDGDGIRETPEGQPLEFDVWIPAVLTKSIDVATVWAMEAKKIGIRLIVSAMDGGTLWAYISPGGEFDIALWNWGGEPDPDFLLMVLTSAQAVEGGWSDSGFSNEEYDRLYELQKRAKTHEERVEIIWRMQEIIHEEIPYIIYVYYGDIDATRNDRLEIEPGLVEGMLHGVVSKVFILNVRVID